MAQLFEFDPLFFLFYVPCCSSTELKHLKAPTRSQADASGIFLVLPSLQKHEPKHQNIFLHKLSTLKYFIVATENGLRQTKMGEEKRWIEGRKRGRSGGKMPTIPSVGNNFSAHHSFPRGDAYWQSTLHPDSLYFCILATDARAFALTWVVISVLGSIFPSGLRYARGTQPCLVDLPSSLHCRSWNK